MTLKELLKHVEEAYPGEFPQDEKQARHNEIGDGLACFIYRELIETQGDPNNVDLDEAERVMLVVLDDVERVLNKIQHLNTYGELAKERTEVKDA